MPFNLPRWAIYAAIAVVALLALFALSQCNRDTTAADQAQQTTASSEAVADAAEVAIEVLENRTATEANIDRAVAAGTLEINNATDADAVRAAVLASVCPRAEFANDAACKVYVTNP